MQEINIFEQFEGSLANYPEGVGVNILEVLENLTKQSSLVEFALADGLSVIRDKYDTNNPKPYHNLAHTQKVILDLVYLNLNATEDEKLTDAELSLTIAAACYHDSVLEFPGDRDRNESESARLAMTNLNTAKAAQLRFEEIYSLQMLIYSTYTTVSANGIVRTINAEDNAVSAGRLSLMSQYLQDADVASLGDNSFFRSTAQLAMEWGKTSDIDFKSFLNTQIGILSNFEFETTAARARCLTKVQDNSFRLKEYLNSTDALNVTFANFCGYFDLSFSDNNGVC